MPYLQLSIRKKIFLLFTLLTLLMLGTFMLLNNIIMSRNIIDLQSGHLGMIAHEEGEDVAHALDSAKRLFSMLAQAEPIEIYSVKHQEMMLVEHFLSYSEQFSALSFINFDGREELRLVDGRLSGDMEDFSENPHFLEAVRNANNVYAALVESSVDDSHFYQFFLAHRSFFDEEAGVIMGLMPAERIAGIADWKDSGMKGRILVIDKHRHLVFDSAGEQTGFHYHYTADGGPARLVFADVPNLGSGRTMIGEEDVLYGHDEIPGADLSIMALAPFHESTSSIRKIRNTALGLFLIVVVAGFLLLNYLSAEITASVRNLVVASDRIAGGDLSSPVIATTRDEIGELSESFDRMRSSLGSSRQGLEEANARLVEMDRLKNMFIASMSHELRTPLNAIIGFTAIILGGMAGPLNEEQEKQLSLVKRSSDHLLSLINDIIDVSCIEAGHAKLQMGEFDLSGLLAEVRDSFSATASLKGIAITLETTASPPILSDERRVKQVAMNLVSNAVKFTDAGSVVIKAATAAGRVTIAVKDTGQGMTEEEIEGLFQPFRKGSNLEKPNVEGTGLGLYISKKIAALLGGDIELRSEPGEGCEFTFTLPTG